MTGFLPAQSADIGEGLSSEEAQIRESVPSHFSRGILSQSHRSLHRWDRLRSAAKAGIQWSSRLARINCFCSHSLSRRLLTCRTIPNQLTCLVVMFIVRGD